MSVLIIIANAQVDDKLRKKYILKNTLSKEKAAPIEKYTRMTIN